MKGDIRKSKKHNGKDRVKSKNTIRKPQTFNSPHLPQSSLLTSNNQHTDEVILKKMLDHKLFKNYNIFYKVNELTKLTGLSRQQIHLYTQMGLIKESYRNASGHRFYSKDVVDRIFLIEMLKRHRTLGEIKKLLKSKYATEDN